jgi:hypothetical protein
MIMFDHRALLLACAAATLCLPVLPAAAEDMVWQVIGEKRPQLVFGIPESDGAMFVANCKSPSAIDVQVATDVTGLSDGEDVDVGFRGRRFNHTSTATVIGVGAEVGISGAQFRISARDSFWQGLVKQATVNYGIAGFAPSTMRFGNDREEIITFLDRCTGKAVAAAPPPVAKTGCSQLGQLKSRNSNQPITITFVNQSGGFRALMWLDFNGQAQDFGGLNAGERKTINTFITHPWMMTDGPGNCQEIYLPKQGDRRFNITKVVEGGGD